LHDRAARDRALRCGPRKTGPQKTRPGAYNSRAGGRAKGPSHFGRDPVRDLHDAVRAASSGCFDRDVGPRCAPHRLMHWPHDWLRPEWPVDARERHAHRRRSRHPTQPGPIVTGVTKPSGPKDRQVGGRRARLPGVLRKARSFGNRGLTDPVVKRYVLAWPYVAPGAHPLPYAAGKQQ